ncbi:MAG: sulfotransferase family 2 domain-containing protein [Cyclobacteriaceae bacterium]
MIGRKKRFIFIHIPKTGGTSVQVSLWRYGKVLQGEQNFDSIYFKHIAATDLKALMGDDFSSYYKFSIVRNPWDWAVSNYLFNRGLHRPFVKNTTYEVHSEIPAWAKEMSFEEWLPWWVDTFNPSQSMMLCDEKGHLLIDEVFRFEALAGDSKKLYKRLKIFKLFSDFPHINQSTRSKSYKEYYSDETHEFISQHFREDIERFGYEF